MEDDRELVGHGDGGLPQEARRRDGVTYSANWRLVFQLNRNMYYVYVSDIRNAKTYDIAIDLVLIEIACASRRSTSASGCSTSWNIAVEEAPGRRISVSPNLSAGSSSTKSAAPWRVAALGRLRALGRFAILHPPGGPPLKPARFMMDGGSQ